MNWRLIFLLSLFGLAMAFATVFWIPSNLEPAFWGVIFIVCAYLIAKRSSGRYFLHGLLTGICNSVWITAIHIFFYSTYMENHPDMAMMNGHMPLQDYPRLLMLLTGPFIGIVSGVVLGVFAIIAGKLVKK